MADGPGGRFQPGHAAHPGSGRPPGVQNKLTRTFKEIILAAQENLGSEHYQNWAAAHPGEHYKIMARLLPQEITAKVEGSVQIVAPHPFGPPGSTPPVADPFEDRDPGEGEGG